MRFKLLVYGSIFVIFNCLIATNLVIYGKQMDTDANQHIMPSSDMMPSPEMSNKQTSMTKMELNKLLRKLWGEHVIWTRQFIVSFLANLPDRNFAKKRLLKNQDDFGKAITPFYGAEAGNELAKLLKEHIVIASEVAKAAKNKNNRLLKVKDELWHENAKQIAQFLAKANPNWSEEELVKMLNKHLALLTDEVTSRLQRNWSKDIVAFDDTYDQALEMGDALAQGIIAQFPDKFSK